MPELSALLLEHVGDIAMLVFSMLPVGILLWLRKYFVGWRAYDARQAKIDGLLEEHDKHLAGHGERLAALEGLTRSVMDALDRLPQREDLAALRVGLSDMRGEVRSVEASVNGLKDLLARQENQISLVHEHLLNR